MFPYRASARMPGDPPRSRRDFRGDIGLAAAFALAGVLALTSDMVDGLYGSRFAFGLLLTIASARVALDAFR